MSAASADNRDASHLRSLAEQFDLEYRDAAAIAVDPLALSLLPPSECRKLRAVPLEASANSAVVGIDAPSEDLFEAVRTQTGRHTRFVLLDERTVDALLSSRMFAEPPAGTVRVSAPPPADPVADGLILAPPAAAEPVAGELILAEQVSQDPVPEDTVADAAVDDEPAAEEPVDDERVDDEPVATEAAFADEPADDEAPLPAELESEPAAALEAEAPEAEAPEAEAPAAEPEEPAAITEPASVEQLPTPTPPTPPKRSRRVSPQDSTPTDLVARIDDAISLWSGLREAVVALNDELEAGRQNLREAKEQLAVARAQSDQDQVRIDTLELELAQDRGLLAAARRRLLDAADALADELSEEPEARVVEPE